MKIEKWKIAHRIVSNSNLVSINHKMPTVGTGRDLSLQLAFYDFRILYEKELCI